MDIYQKIKIEIESCVKSNNNFKRDVLKTLVGEIQLNALRNKKEINDELTTKILKSFKQNSELCLKELKDEEKIKSIHSEISIYNSFLPEEMTEDQILNLLLPIQDKLSAFKNHGQAMGFAVKYMKENNIHGVDKRLLMEILKKGIHNNEK